MDPYTCNFVYYGTIISQEQYDSLTSIINPNINTTDTHVYSSIYIRKTSDKYLLFISTTYYNFRNVKSLFHTDNIQQGFISITDVERCLRSNNISETRIDSIFYPDHNEKQNLAAIVSLLEFDTDIKLVTRLEMAEILNDQRNISSGILSYILPIR